MLRLKHFVPRTLFGRSLLIIVTPLIVLQVVAAYIFYERHWDNVSRHLALGLVGDITAVMQLIEAFPDKTDQAIVLWTARVFMRIDTHIEPGAVLAEDGPPPSCSATCRRPLTGVTECPILGHLSRLEACLM